MTDDEAQRWLTDDERAEWTTVTGPWCDPTNCNHLLMKLAEARRAMWDAHVVSTYGSLICIFCDSDRPAFGQGRGRIECESTCILNTFPRPA